jgi:thiamine pyrophosphokinase
MGKVLFIVTGGELKDLAFLRSKIDTLKPAAIICADSGAAHLYALGMIPDAILGDMDSLDPKILNYFEGRGCNIIKYPEGKDETDTWLALDYAMRLVPDEIYLFAASGTRIDHTLANLSLLIQGMIRNVPVKIVDAFCEIFLLKDKCVIEGEVGQTVSVLPFSGTVTGVTLKGFEFPLENAIMEPGMPYGVSNRLRSTRGTIEVRSGYLLVIRYFKTGFFP